MFKKYVKVTATFDCDGSLVPNYIFGMTTNAIPSTA